MSDNTKFDELRDTVDDNSTVVSGSVPTFDAQPSPTLGEETVTTHETHNEALPISRDASFSVQRLEEYVEELLNGMASYTVAEASQMSGLSSEEILRFWRALGFPMIEDVENERLFTPADVEAMRAHAQILRPESNDVGLNREVVNMLVRAQSQSMSRLVFWQQEAFVEYAETVLGYDASDARAWLLEHMSEYEEFLSAQMSYVWRRHLAAVLRRTEWESDSVTPDMTSNYVSRRALGFIDMVSFTRRSGELGNMELLDLIDTFDHVCRDIITSKGGRVVKNIGDSFLYTADSIEIALDITTRIVEKVRTIEGMLPVHASVVWGEVISRFGDVFGTTVNLASRIADAAMPNTVLTDEKTAAIIQKIGLKYTSVDLGHRDLPGLGPTRLMELRRIMST